ncbi:Uncharacterised protein [Streptococcus pneumoniae]|nr:Uncharacterised protein [Streptococcus pneumoniae]COF43903.1 Uncharacterised protein [Streptococcus pneumoniae]COF64983.1 Uncharacterised protein [Streptococcus pneumoniae]COP64611.1 Uncharacterised protein [Streptococcus pneumoniae]COP97121.1 Uncharacterised protein [Streptococcus pneumoniae]
MKMEFYPYFDSSIIKFKLQSHLLVKLVAEITHSSRLSFTLRTIALLIAFYESLLIYQFATNLIPIAPISKIVDAIPT